MMFFTNKDELCDNNLKFFFTNPIMVCKKGRQTINCFSCYYEQSIEELDVPKIIKLHLKYGREYGWGLYGFSHIVLSLIEGLNNREIASYDKLCLAYAMFLDFCNWHSGVNREVDVLLFQNDLKNLIKEGVIKNDGEKYSLTPLGKKILEFYNDMTKNNNLEDFTSYNTMKIFNEICDKTQKCKNEKGGLNNLIGKWKKERSY